MKKFISLVTTFATVFSMSAFGLIVPTAVNAVTLNDGLVSYWNFDESSGPAIDNANDNDGALQGDATRSADKPIIPSNISSLSLDGAGDYVDCGSAVDSGITTGITLEAWIKPTARQNGGIISSDITYSSKKGYDFFLWSAGGSYGRLYIDFGNGSTLGRTFWDIPGSDWYGQWHQVAATWNGSTIKLYSDGVKVSEVAFSGTYSDPGKNTFIGAINYLTPASYYFNRFIDEVRIYNRALNPDEISALADYANFGITSLTPPEAFNPVGIEHTVTATLDPDLSFVPVLFEVTGANTDGKTVYTDGNGQALFSYTGTSAGKDTVIACIDVNDDGNCDGEEPQASATKYWLGTFVTGGGNIKVDKTVRWTFSGVVGVAEGIGLVGNFQIIDHLNNNVCRFDSFDSLKFDGPAATSPAATHNKAEFSGPVTCSNEGGPVELTVIIEDLCESGVKGAKMDKIKINGLGITEQVISGGNFQVHDIPAEIDL